MSNYMMAVRNAIESQYDCICDIFEYRKIKDSTTKITNFKEIRLHKEIPCKISFDEIYVNSETDTESKIKTKVKLFINPELVINPGSKIVVTKNGKTTIYKNSGKAADYNTHQEIMLDEFKGWA